MTLLSFLKMGGYAAYVWPAFGSVLSVLVYNSAKAYVTYRMLIKRLSSMSETRHAPYP